MSLKFTSYQEGEKRGRGGTAQMHQISGKSKRKSWLAQKKRLRLWPRNGERKFSEKGKVPTQIWRERGGERVCLKKDRPSLKKEGEGRFPRRKKGHAGATRRTRREKKIATISLRHRTSSARESGGMERGLHGGEAGAAEPVRKGGRARTP